MYFYRYLGERLEDSATRAGVRAVEDRAARGRRLQTITYDEALRDKIIVGTPERVTDRLMGLKEKLGLDGILRRDELRHQDPAPAGDEVAAAAVRRGEAAFNDPAANWAHDRPRTATDGCAWRLTPAPSTAGASARARRAPR